jgi:hypothetical protein
LTLVEAVNCIDGLFFMSDRKIAFRYKPPEYVDYKVTSEFQPIVIGFADDVWASKNFVENALLEAQRQSYDRHILPKPQENWKSDIISGVVLLNIRNTSHS